MQETCVFCDEFEAGENTLAQTDVWRARWDLYPVTPGHVELVPKRHVQYLEELSEEELAQMMPFAREVKLRIREANLTELYTKFLPASDDRNRPLQEAVLQSLKERGGLPDAFNFGINDGSEAGQSVPHFHLHIMPRWAGDIENPRGGVRNIFANDTYKNLK